VRVSRSRRTAPDSKLSAFTGNRSNRCWCARPRDGDASFEADTTSWSEVEFGLVSVPEGARSPWPLDGDILIGTEKLKLSGRIDRVDFAAGGRGVRISDYKTGATPWRPEKIVVDRGKELQRVLYATAVGQLVPEASRIISRLIYLDGVSPPFALNRETLEAAAADVAGFLGHRSSRVTDESTIYRPI
jgi:hypothetical protein